MSEPAPVVSVEDRRAWLAGLGAALLVLAVDSQIPLGTTIGTLQVVAVLATVRAASLEPTLGIGLLGAALVWVGWWLSPAGADAAGVLANRGLSTLAVALVTLLLARYQQTRREREAADREASEVLRRTLAAAPDAMLLFGEDGRIVDANPAAEALFGYSGAELFALEPDALLPEASRRRHARFRAELALPEAGAVAMARGRAVRARKKGGTEAQVDVRLSAFERGGKRTVVAAVRDVSVERALEQRLQQTQRMEAIGRLAGGIAHDFNNIITVVTNHATFAKEELPPDSRAHEDLDVIQQSAEQAARLTAQVLAFSRKQIVQPRSLSLNQAVAELDKLLRRSLGEDVELQVVLAENLWTVRADPSQVEQILMNLAVNARDAMRHGGKLTVETENVTLDQEYADEHPEVMPGEYVRLSVSDTGEGIPESVRAKIFEPFFTTKEQGKGTGLGLATVHGAVRQMGGHVWVYSEVGRGTTFKIYLPRSAQSALSLTPSPPSPGARSRDETVLLVEDDAGIRGVAAKVLRRAGYKVLVAAGPEEAKRAYAERPGPVDLLLTDVVMPGASGQKLATELRRESPALRVVYMSGYTDNAIVHNGELEIGLTFVQKPFTPAVLLEKVRAALDAPS
jgi:PAS domain S-box-containing protein